MKTLHIVLGLLLAVWAGWLPGCEESGPPPEGAQASADAGEMLLSEYLETVQTRLSAIEAKEREHQKKAAAWEGKAKQEFESRLAFLVQRRVFAKERLQELRAANDESLAGARAQLEPAMKEVAQAYQRLEDYMR